MSRPFIGVLAMLSAFHFGCGSKSPEAGPAEPPMPAAAPVQSPEPASKTRGGMGWTDSNCRLEVELTPADGFDAGEADELDAIAEAMAAQSEVRLQLWVNLDVDARERAEASRLAILHELEAGGVEATRLEFWGVRNLGEGALVVWGLLDPCADHVRPPADAVRLDAGN